MNAKRFVIGASISVGIAGLLPNAAYSQHDDHGTEQARRDFLHSGHPLSDANIGPDWHVQTFERDGVTFYQISDQYGRIQLFVGELDGQFWILESPELEVGEGSFPVPVKP